MVLNGSIFNLGSALGGALGGLLLTLGGFTALGLGLPLFALAASLCAWSAGPTSTPSRPNAAWSS
jgi:predicted MFS family arabinose efflux permease